MSIDAIDAIDATGAPPLSGDVEAFSVRRRLVHAGTEILTEEPLTFCTPSPRWAYAIELPKSKNVLEAGPAVLLVRLRVRKGTLGILCVGHDDRLIVEVEATASDEDASVSIQLASLLSCRSLIFRNTSLQHEPTEVQILSVRTQRGSGVRQAPPPLITIDPAIFEAFGRWEGTTPAGHWTDWLGVRTRADVWAFSDAHLAVYNVERFERPPYPLNTEHVLDWLPLLDAVLAADDTFSIVALGAGWGRWLTAGAFAAQRTGRQYRLIGVEAEPTHFSWLERHMDDNGIRMDWCRLLHGAASSLTGDCWFRIGDSAAWYGQSILADAAVPQLDGSQTALWSVAEADGATLQRVRSYDMGDIVGELPIVDYMHMDIQGSELDFLSARPDILQARVRQVNIGTHSESIERNLRRFFTSLGWTPKYDIPLDGQARIGLLGSPSHLQTFGDGVQVWINPKLSSVGEAAPL